MLVALHVEPGPDLVDQVGRDAPALGRRVEPDAVQPIAQCMRDPEGLLRLVLERVDQHDPGDVRPEMAVEREGRLHRIAEDQHQRVGHRPGRGETGEPRPGRRRRTDAAADDRRVIEHVGDVRMDMPRPEADHRFRRGDIDDLASGRRPAGRLGEHPEQRRLVQPEPPIAGADPEHDLARPDPVAVIERLDRRLVRIALREHVPQQVLGLVDAAQDRLAAREDLHGHDRIEAFGRQDAVGAREIDVG